MSSSGYRDRERRDFVPRGGGYTRGRGGGRGGFNKPRRYWDNDEYYDKGGGGDRRRYSRSRSRSYSRSRSRSRSQSPPQRDRKRSPERSQAQYQEPNNWKPAPAATAYVSEYGSQQQLTMQANGSADNTADIQRLRQLQKYQMQQSSLVEDPSLTFGGYPAQQQPHQQFSHSTDGLGLAMKVEQSTDKKKKEKRKKKKNRKRSSSSSSSSSSSDSSSGSRRKSDSSASESDSKSRKEKPSTVDNSAPSNKLTEEQRKALFGQQGAYKLKLDILEKEIAKLQVKEKELRKNRAEIVLIEENLKLQAELVGRCKAVNVVLDKINNVLIAARAVEKPVAPPPPKISESKEHERKPSLPSIKELADVEYVDNGQHWCRLCNVFPESVEQMLKHFHSQAHRDQVEQLGIDDKPWHKKDPESDNKALGPSAKKCPFRGMQFFSPVEGWYCRLCNSWMGDQHCASIHLKSVEHNSNYMTFLEEHSEWEAKWNVDREKARLRALPTMPQPGLRNKFESENDENNRSIRVQMRNVKVEEAQSVKEFSSNDAKDNTGIDEWMGKPTKAKVDVIDTQKFVEIVRQRHGALKKEEEAAALKSRENTLDQNRRSSPGGIKGRESFRDDRKRYDRVEMQLTSRENRDRDRFNSLTNRERGDRGGNNRRRSRSRSRSRDRDRGYHGRGRRSRSRSRDRRDRDRDRDRDGGRRVETVKKLPIIGKMPLYKRTTNKDTPTDTLKDTSSVDPTTFDTTAINSAQYAEYDESMMSASYSVGETYAEQPEGEQSNTTTATAAAADYVVDDTLSSYPLHDPNLYVPVETTSVPLRPDTDLKPPGEKEAPGGTNLPDDLQHALDIIYKGGGKPIPIPPPNFIPLGVPPPNLAGYGYPPNYMGYEGYKFEGYSANDMEEINYAGNVPIQNATETKPEEKKPVVEKSEEVVITPVHAPPPIEKKEEPELDEGGDDMDDLRMLGIDVDDVAVVKK